MPPGVGFFRDAGEMPVTPGPKPKPGEIAAQQGNPGHRPIVTAPSAPSIDPTTPDWLDDQGREIWSLYMPKLRSMGFVKETDRMAFARLCDHTARWMRLRVKVNAKGESYETVSRHGTMNRINPDFAAMLRLEEKLVSLEDRFGLTPAARQQILSRLTGPGDIDVTNSGQAADASPSSPIGMFAPRPRTSDDGRLN